MSTSGQKTPSSARRENRLGAETSPYLRQHRFNPVEWWPWGEEAFAEARRRDVPIFLSIGYSTCYWCHVMERESFESESIARLMNERFVCVKVDREERPDVDDLYMAAVQAFTGRGGWPMSVFLEPAGLRPFWAGTYFPAEEKFHGIPTFPSVIEGVSAAWRERRGEVLEQAAQMGEAVRERVVAVHAPARVDEGDVGRAVGQLLRLADRTEGGFRPAPKFPQPVYLELLLAARRSAGDAQTRAAIDGVLRLTLDKMALGGLFDQVGGGFHRYSTDGRWLVPHFEKMLYDNAMLAGVYARAGREYDDAFYKRIAQRTAEYVLREMVDEGGGFWSAQDAEVNHREGQNYLWTREQVRGALGEKDAEFAIEVYQITEAGNFRDPHHPEDWSSNVLSMAARPEELARKMKMSEAEFLERLDRVNAALLDARGRRDQPGTDTKVLAAWNGMMIAGLAKCGEVLGDARFTRTAERAASFVMRNMRGGDGVLMRSFSGGRAQVAGFLEDYAMMAGGLCALSEAGADEGGRMLGMARELVDAADAAFGDAESGAWYDTRVGQGDLFVRSRGVYDGAVPSGTSAMIHALVDLSRLTGEARYLERAARGFAGVSGYVAEAPLGAANSSLALLEMLGADRAVVEGALSRAGAREKTGAPAAEVEGEAQVVEILAPEGVRGVEIAPEEPAGLTVRVRIAAGYHVIGATPGESEFARGLAPFAVRIINGTGVAVYADYPKGEEFGQGDERVRVYSGEFELPIVLERVGTWSGRPLIAVTYQACTSSECLRARTVELDVAIDRK